MAKRVGQEINYDDTKLRFTPAGTSTASVKQPIKRTANQTVGEIMSPGYPVNATASQSILLYELLDVSITELETKKSLKIIWTGSQNREEVSDGMFVRMAVY